LISVCESFAIKLAEKKDLKRKGRKGGKKKKKRGMQSSACKISTSQDFLRAGRMRVGGKRDRGGGRGEKKKEKGGKRRDPINSNLNRKHDDERKKEEIGREKGGAVHSALFPFPLAAAHSVQGRREVKGVGGGKKRKGGGGYRHREGRSSGEKGVFLHVPAESLSPSVRKGGRGRRGPRREKEERADVRSSSHPVDPQAPEGKGREKKKKREEGICLDFPTC